MTIDEILKKSIDRKQIVCYINNNRGFPIRKDVLNEGNGNLEKCRSV